MAVHLVVPIGGAAVPLRVKYSLSVATLDDLAALSAICNTLERHACSIEVYGRILQDRPNDSTAVANLAMALTRSGAYDEALRHYRRYLALGGGALDALHGYATTLRALGRPDEAIEWYYRTLQGDPSLLDVTREFVELLIQNSRHIEALSVIGAFSRRFPDYKAYWAGNVAAIDSALQADTLRPGSPTPFLKIPALGEHHFVPVKLSRRGSFEFFLVDSGAATFLTLGRDVIVNSGVQPQALGKHVILETATGFIEGDLVSLPEILVGLIPLVNVEAVLCDRCPLLMGQSLLRRFNLRTFRQDAIEFLVLMPR